MTRLFLAAGVAALAIASAASAMPPGGGHGGGNPHGGGSGPQPQPQQQRGGGNPHGGGGAPQMQQQRGGGHGGGFAAPQMQRVERQQFRGPEMRAQRQQFHAPQMQRIERQQFARQQVRGPQRVEHQQAAREQVMHQKMRRMEHQPARVAQQHMQQQRGMAQRQMQQQMQQRGLGRQQARADLVQQGRAAEHAQQQLTIRNPAAAERIASFRNADTSFAGNGTRGLIDGCPPGLWMKNNGCMPPGQAAKLLGTPLAAAGGLVPLSDYAQPLSYLYPDTPDYYYRYGDGYLYQVDRGTNLIASLLPLIGGGYVPGQYLPQPYMASYVPDYYGLDSFYPDYGGLCNRYADGVVYEVDCATGYVENVIPMYAGGYGVGQMLPSAYGYYNVPMQYRSMYYDTPDYGYWYAPGAIYQYDQRSSLITSVAALMAPGFSIGQPLPMGYDVYNVPYDYRTTYYDTPNAWYRYNNGYIYQVDPATQIVTAIVASLLT